MLSSHHVMPDSLQLHGLQHARPPCPPPFPGVCPGSCSLHQWCHPAISSSDALFSFSPQSCPASRTFPKVVYSHQMTRRHVGFCFQQKQKKTKSNMPSPNYFNSSYTVSSCSPGSRPVKHESSGSASGPLHLWFFLPEIPFPLFFKVQISSSRDIWPLKFTYHCPAPIIIFYTL